MVSCSIKPSPESVSHQQHKDIDGLMIQNSIYAANDSKVNMGLGMNACNPPTTTYQVPSDLIVKTGGNKKLNTYIGKINNLKNNIKAENFLDAAKIFSKKINKNFKIDDKKNRIKHTFFIINTKTNLLKKYELINERVKHKLYNFKHTIRQLK